MSKFRISGVDADKVVNAFKGLGLDDDLNLEASIAVFDRGERTKPEAFEIATKIAERLDLEVTDRSTDTIPADWYQIGSQHCGIIVHWCE